MTISSLFRRAGLGAICFALLAAALAIAAEPRQAFRSGDWPFRPLAAPSIPQVVANEWCRNPIDRFVLSALEEKGLAPSPESDRATLLRRLSFDLVGLPPTEAELDSFLADDSPDAYEKIVEAMLGSPRFGEHQAQDWLDLVRYAESAGYKIDELRPEAWRYRDYVIRAFNRDLPYDRFVRQQLAGDELEPGNREALIATGYNRMYLEESNTSDFHHLRQDILDDVTEVTGLAFLGLTVGCAKCHDHKVDPILQTDFYRLEACFAPMLARHDLTVASPEEAASYQVQQQAWEEATQSIRGEMDQLVASCRKESLAELAEGFDPVTRAAMELPIEERTPLQRELIGLADRAMKKSSGNAYRRLETDQRKRYDELKEKLAKFEAQKPASLPGVLAVTDVGATAPATHLLAQGNFNAPQQEVQSGFPEFLGASEPEKIELQNANTTGRRASLATWLTRPDHPLTARVMANRVWQHHFGKGIVASASDFGAFGTGASHPELLDYLAFQLVENGWSLKGLRRMIVTSAAYRQTARIDSDSLTQKKGMQADVQNSRLWRSRRRRLSAEAVRDAMLALSGDLQLPIGGPSCKPEVPVEVAELRYAWAADALPADQQRRSVYIFARRNFRLPMAAAFDLPDRINSCAVRMTTVTAPQALSLLNGKFSLDQAAAWGKRLLAAHAEDREELVRSAYRQAFSRAPSAAELAAATTFLARQEQLLTAEGALVPNRSAAAAAEGAVTDFCHALFNSSEFLHIE